LLIFSGTYVAQALQSQVTRSQAQKKGRQFIPSAHQKECIPSIFDSKHIKQAHEFIANKTGVETEKDGEKSAGSDAVEKSRFREKYKYQNSEGRHRQLGACKQHRAVGHDSVHDRVYFYHAAINKLQGQECVRTGQQHRSRSKEKQPWVMPVQKNHVIVDYATVHMSAGAYESKKYSSPAKIAAFVFCTLIAYCAAKFHAVLLP
jgi:hypothetical protein